MFQNYKHWKLLCTLKAGGLASVEDYRMYMQEKEMLEAADEGKKDFDSQIIKKELHLPESKMKAMKIENDNVMNQDLDDIRAQLIIEMEEVIRVRVVSEDDWDTMRKMMKEND